MHFFGLLGAKTIMLLKKKSNKFRDRLRQSQELPLIYCSLLNAMIFFLMKQ